MRSDSTDAVDFAFLKAQTFDDTDLERELLELFVGQVQKILPTLQSLPPKDQADTAHLLKGSARSIGARAAARAAEDYENAAFPDRPLVFPALSAAFAAAETAITRRLAALRS